MKKQLFLGITALALLAGTGTSLASCADTTSSSIAQVYPEATVTLNRTSIQAEIGGEYTLRATVNSSAAITNFMSNFTVDNPNIVEIKTTATGTTNITFVAKALGTATITAASAVNPNATATCTITVVEARPTLASLFDSLNAKHNYTLTATIDGFYADPESKEPITVTDTTILTDNALIQYTDIGGEETAIWTLKDLPLYGIVVNEEGEAVYLQYDESGKVVSPAERILSASGGFLNADNFDGSGLSTPASGAMFVSLASIDTSYYPTEKATDNIYEIEGTDKDEDFNDVLVEVGLLMSFAPEIYQTMVQSVVGSDGRYSLIDVVDLYTTTIEVLGEDNFEVTFDLGDGATIVGTISKVGTTSLNDISTMLPTVAKDIESIEVVVPALNSELEAVAEAFEGDNYVQKRYSYLGDEYYESSYNIYYAENYIFLYYDEQYVSDYNENQPGEDPLTVGGFGIYYKDGNLIYFDTDDTTVINAEVLATAQDPTPDTKLSDFDIFSLAVEAFGGPAFTNYFTSSSAYSEDREFFYQFPSDKTPLWQGDPTEYYVATSDAASLTAQGLVWGYAISEPGTDYEAGGALTGLNVVMSAGAVSEVNFSFGWLAETTAEGGMYSVSKAGYSNFGKAETANPVNEAIETYMASYEPSTPAA